ncbi:MAG: hypothetical protein EOO00_03060 [Chitinophagaceae bacterium]|nr:MAG: hypothetical protein EOO00_03060 [Chitinophagaceae bacterium]
MTNDIGRLTRCTLIKVYDLQQMRPDNELLTDYVQSLMAAGSDLTGAETDERNPYMALRRKKTAPVLCIVERRYQEKEACIG